MNKRIQQKYINFPRHWFFQPMLSPADCLNLGIFEGQPYRAPRVVSEAYPKISQLADSEKWHATIKHASMNYFEISADHKDPTFAKNFFYWYTEFYFDHLKRTTEPEVKQDLRMIGTWAKYIHAMWKGIILNEATGEFMMSEGTRQALIEVAWNPYYEPNFTLEQCLTGISQGLK